jgi:hypothetical protein
VTFLPENFCLFFYKLIPKLILGLVLMVYTSLLNGQTLIDGKINSKAGEALSGINILVFSQNVSSSILTYSITNELGLFDLSFTSIDDSIVISVKSINYRDTTFKLQNKSQHLKLKLSTKQHSIKEVNVRGYSIYGNGDTLTYLVNSFARQKDQSLADVMKRMPGFEVTDKGQIYYQGQPIQKYYIEGMDLLEQRYPLANNNLPYQSISSVEVMQNHQPVKMLEKMIPSDQTSINIKLKKDVVLTGTLYAGIGAFPLLRDINMTPMLFSKRQQIIGSWQSNNFGKNLNVEHQPLLFENGNLEGLKNRKIELLGIKAIYHPEMEESRFLKNSANLLNYNHLVKVNPTTNLKVNISYYNDHINEEGSTLSTYFFNAQTITINEGIENRYNKNSLSTDLTFIHNAPNRYLKDQLSFNRFWDSEQRLILTDQTLSEKVQTPHLSLANVMDIMLPVKHQLVNFYSFIDYNQSPQSLTITPGVFHDVLNNGDSYEQTHQYFSISNLLSHHYLSFIVARKSWVFSTEPGVEYEFQQLNSYIETDNNLLFADSLNNGINWTRSRSYINERITFKKKNNSIGLELPISNISYHIDDNFVSSPRKLQKFVFTPRVLINYHLNSRLEIAASAKYSSLLGDITQITQGYMLSSYNQMRRNSGELTEKEGLSYRVSLMYKNPISGFFSNLTWMESRLSNNLLFIQRISNDGLFYEDFLEKDHKWSSDNVTLKCSQYVSGIHSTFNIQGNYSRLKRAYMVNENLGWSTNQLFLLNSGVTVAQWKYVNLEYSYNYQLIKQQNTQSAIDIMQQKHKGSLTLLPNRKNLLGLYFEYYVTQHEDQSANQNVFTDISYWYKPDKAKIKFKLELRNIFERSTVIQYYSSDISLVRNCFSIRPREFLFTLSYGL